MGQPVRYYVWTDGSIEGGNPGGHGVAGYIIRTDSRRGDVLQKGAVDLGKSPSMTNNIAEYEAVVAALTSIYEYAEKSGRWPDVIYLHSDSKLVVEQCEDRWNCNNEVLRKLRDRVWDLCDRFDLCSVSFTWIPREENQEADAVSRSLYDK